jgi:hypothetical protein
LRKSRSLHLERDEVRVQVRRQWGYLNENPIGEKRSNCRGALPNGRRRPVQLTAAEFLPLTRLGPREKVAVAFVGWFDFGSLIRPSSAV